MLPPPTRALPVCFWRQPRRCAAPGRGATCSAGSPGAPDARALARARTRARARARESHTPRFLRSKTRQPTDEAKRRAGPKQGKKQKKQKKAKPSKKRSRLSRASSSDEEGDDEDDGRGWGSSSSADDEEEEEEEEEDLDEYVRRAADKPAMPKLKKPRSNDNCFRTVVTCPKCRAEWG